MTNLELIVERQLSQQEAEKICYLVNKYAIIDYTVSLNEDKDCVEFEAVLYYAQEGNNYEYNIALKEHTTDEAYESIVQGIADIIPDAFEFMVHTPE